MNLTSETFKNLKEITVKNYASGLYESVSDSPEFELNIPDDEANYLFSGILEVSAQCCPQPTIKIIDQSGKAKLVSAYFNPNTRKFTVNFQVDLKSKISFCPFYQKDEFKLYKVSLKRIGLLRQKIILFLRFLKANTAGMIRLYSLCYRFLLYIKRHGLKSTYHRGLKFIKSYYSLWVLLYDRSLFIKKNKIYEDIKNFKNKPKISIVMPVYNVEKKYFEKAINSVFNQLYTNWELCLADDCSTMGYIKPYLQSLTRDPRVKVIFRSSNGHISEATNSALNLATGDYIALMDNDDMIPRHALYEVVKVLNQYPSAELIYSDEDKMDENDRRFMPFFKPDWSPDLFYSMNILTHLNIFKADLAKKTAFRKGYEGSQDYDFCLRFISLIDQKNIIHVPKVLYHWRAIEGSVALDSRQKQYAHEVARKSIKEYLIKEHPGVDVVSGYGPLHRVVYQLDESQFKVSIIICTRDNKDVLEKAIESILNKTKYSNYEIIIVDNGSVKESTLAYFKSLESNTLIRVIRLDVEFNFSFLNNEAVKYSNGNVICFLNDDIEIKSENWLYEMVSLVQNEKVGAVGAKLHYPNGHIQHFGIVTGLVGGVAGHQFKFFDSNSEGYFGRLKVVSNVSAVTGACLIIKKNDFLRVGGFDSDNLKVAYNDVDLCLKLLNLGLRNLVTPFAEIIHYESLTRGSDVVGEKRIRLERESNFMKNKWAQKLNDRYYNVNLSDKSESYDLAWPPRKNDGS